MKIKLSGWSIALLLIVIVLALNLAGIIHVDAWGIFGIVVTIGCAWLIYYIFLRKK
jgi:hypothetical protein